ncbi:hypothetical protein CPB84DRAFT_1749723 [Gymnopilus junonius]|uniref:Uncharacterized protein n=1 Tax=Gymnopilus junonius TaxID=109634 RepID=A0A9P5NGS5_GYMJU|nr:hypothetical protein CPB84DRAFT_1749723 [Gymnopilus junonius]
MVRYTKTHTTSGNIVRQDPEHMKCLSTTFQANGTEVPLDSGAISDPHAAILFYDRKLSEPAKDFVDYYHHFHYASSAAILLLAHVIGPRAAQDDAFSVAYNKSFTELKTQGPRQSSHSKHLINIPLSEAEHLANVSIRVLRNKKFYSLGGGDPDEAGKWQVVKYNSGEQEEEEEYSVHFAGLQAFVSHSRLELIKLLTESIEL